MHGDVAVSSAGEIYVSVQDPKAGVQVYSADGKWIRNVKGAPNDFHGFVIRKQEDGEFLYRSAPRWRRHSKNDAGRRDKATNSRLREFRTSLKKEDVFA